MKRQKLSLVVPVFNEQENILLFYETVTDVIQTIVSQYQYEIIFINDGSHDDSWHIINLLSTSNPAVKAVNFTRNFGHQIALTAGYDHADGDAIITLDVDLQDPPQLILAMLQAWERGFAIVYARRINRHDSFFKKITADCYYRILSLVSDVTIPRNVGDYRLIDKNVLHTLRECREKARYLRGMVAWTGFKHTFVDFERLGRNAGQTGYTWHKMFKLAFDGLTGFSLFPLKIAAFMGFFVVATGSLMLSYITIDAVLFRVDYPLFKWLVTIIYMCMGVQFILLWFIGEYIGRMYEQQQNRPLYIIQGTVNFADTSAAILHQSVSASEQIQPS